MKLITLDFETYYDRATYSITKMQTEGYITDPRFETIMVGVKEGDDPAYIITGSHKQISKQLHKLDWANAALLAYNTRFDGLILQHHYGIIPRFYFDAMQMAQAVIRPYVPKLTLKEVVAYVFDGQIAKGDEVHRMSGRSRQSLSRQETETYAEYCINDVEITKRLFYRLLPFFTRSELRIAHLTHMMYMVPRVELDAALLARRLHRVRNEKARLLDIVKQSGVDQKDLMSNVKFADLLRARGVEVPIKISPTTGKETYAFAKTDPGFIDMMEEHADNEEVSALIAARVGTKSTIEETRIERLLDIARTHKLLRVPLGYYKAHTGRYGGDEKINLQNLPRPKKNETDSIRHALRAPKGQSLLAADLSQIEARIVAWLAAQNDLIMQFSRGVDVYSLFASIAYGTETVKGRSHEDDRRRFVGKTCILGLGYGMGAVKLASTLKKDGVIIEDTEAQRLVNVYRNTYSRINATWTYCGIMMIPSLIHGHGSQGLGPVITRKGLVVLPNSMALHYHNIRRNIEGDYLYTYGRETRKLFGGKLFENIVQALARIVIMNAMLRIEDELGLVPVMQIHDELVYLIPSRREEEYMDKVRKIMVSDEGISWASGLPIGVEIKCGPTYGDCK